MIRLLFVDDHPVVAEGLAGRFRAVPGFDVVAAVPSVAQALPLARAGRVDVAVLDVQLDVLITPAQVAELARCCRVVLFSARRVDEQVRALLDAGAAGFVDKGAPLDRLDAVLRQAHTGQAPVPVVQQPGVKDKVTPRELEVYRALALGRSPKEVAAQLGLATSTVYCHVERLKEKLGVRSLQELVAHAYTHRDS